MVCVVCEIYFSSFWESVFTPPTLLQYDPSESDNSVNIYDVEMLMPIVLKVKVCTVFILTLLLQYKMRENEITFYFDKVLMTSVKFVDVIQDKKMSKKRDLFICTFSWKLLKFGSLNDQVHDKNVPNLKAGWSARRSCPSQTIKVVCPKVVSVT